jgi:hypothetical protein
LSKVVAVPPVGLPFLQRTTTRERLTRSAEIACPWGPRRSYRDRVKTPRRAFPYQDTGQERLGRPDPPPQGARRGWRGVPQAAHRFGGSICSCATLSLSAAMIVIRRLPALAPGSRAAGDARRVAMAWLRRRASGSPSAPDPHDRRRRPPTVNPAPGNGLPEGHHRRRRVLRLDDLAPSCET